MGTAFYDMAVYSTTNPTTPVFYYRYINASTHCTGDLCSFDPIWQSNLHETARLTNATYNVYLRSTGGEWEGPFSFTLNALPPSPVSFLDTNDVRTRRPTIQWTLPGEAAYATQFRLYLIKKALFDAGVYTPVADFWVSRIQACTSATSITCSRQSAIDLEEDVAYYLFIQSSGPGGLSVGGAQYNNGWAGLEFTVNAQNDTPLPTGVQVNTNQGNPTISWTGDPSINRYHVVIFNWTSAVGFMTNGMSKWRNV